MLDLSVRRVMIDLETLSAQKDAAIISLGAVQFGHGVSPDSAVQFYQKCDPQDSERWGLHVDRSTMLWWDEQDPSTRAEAFSGTQPLGAMLSNFEQWMLNNFGDLENVELWSKGSDFDLVVLPNAYYTCLSTYPFNFRMHRCFRTLESLMNPGLLQLARNSQSNIKKHNALADAQHQAMIANVALANLSFNLGYGPGGRGEH